MLAVGLVLGAGASTVSPVSASEKTVDSLIVAGHEAGRADRHSDAIDAYESVIRLAPDRRADVSARLAFQYAWANRLQKSKREFAFARTHAPDDVDLQLGELLVTNWMGRHLEAWRGYNDLSRREPDDPAPLMGLATAQNWLGRPDLSLRTVQRVYEIEPDHRDARNLESSIRTGLRPVAGLFVDVSEDSDDYAVTSVVTEVAYSPHPLVRVVPSINRLAITRPGSDRARSLDVVETWLAVTATARPVTRLGLWGRFALITNPEDGSDYGPLTSNVSAEWMVADPIRVAAFYDRFAVFSDVSLPDKITGEIAGLSLNVFPDPPTRVRVVMDWGKYSDENSRRNAWLTASREVWDRARVRLGVAARYLDFDRWLPNGIWTPVDFRAGGVTLEADYGVRDVWSLNGSVELGSAKEDVAEGAMYATYRLGFFRSLGRWLLDASVGHSEGNVETGTGYERTYAHAGLRIRL